MLRIYEELASKFLSVVGHPIRWKSLGNWLVIGEIAAGKILQLMWTFSLERDEAYTLAAAEVVA
jgi:hypothetical protein